MFPSPARLLTTTSALGLALACAPAFSAQAAPGQPMDEAALAAVHGAGLDPAALQALLQDALAGLSARNEAPVPDLTRALADASVLDRQALQLQRQLGSQAIDGSIRAASTLASLALVAPVAPLMLPVIGLPFLGLLPALPPRKKDGG